MSSSSIWRALTAAAVMAVSTPMFLLDDLESAAQQTCGNYAVAIAPQTPGQPLTNEEIVVTSAAGDEVARVPFAQASRVSPSSLSGYAIVHSFDKGIAVLDVESGTISPIDLGEASGPITTDPFFKTSSGSPFMVFGTVTFEDAYLVDIKSGQSLALSTLLAAPGPIPSASISPNGERLLFSSGFDSYLVSLSDLSGTAPLDPAARARDAQFSADGSTVFYIVDTGAVPVIRARNLVTGDALVVASRPELGKMFVLDNDDLMLLSPESVVLVNSESGVEQLFDLPNRDVWGAYVDPARSYLAVDSEVAGQQEWTLIDLETTEMSSPPELQGRTGFVMPGEAGWLVLPPSVGPVAGVPGSPYLSLDLQSGEIRQLLSQDSSEIYNVAPAGDAEGRYTLVNAVSPGSGRLWLLDAASGTSTLVGQSTGNAQGLVTPDGCQLAVSTFDTLGEGRQGSVQLYSLPDLAPGITIPDAVLLGWVEI